MAGKFLHIKSKTITSAAFILAASTLVSKLLGLIRDRILAGKFGAGDELDIYYTVFRIPDTVYAVFILGAVSSAFIPVFSQYLARDEKEAWRLANTVLTISVAALLLVSFILIIFAPFIVPLIAPGFQGEKLSLTIFLTRIMFLSPVIFGISSVVGAVLQISRRFFVYSLAPIFYNAGIIIGALWLTDVARILGFERLAGLVAGVLLGAVLHLCIQIPSAVTSGFRYRPLWDFAHSGFRKVVSLFIPRMIGLAVYQINFFVITALASTLREGSIAVFNLANNLQYLPIGIFGISFATAAFPVLSEKFSKNDKIQFSGNFFTTLRTILVFVVPLSVFFFLLRAQIVRMVLGTGEFGWDDTRLTAAALGIFAISIVPQSIIPLLARGFYALHDTKTPVMVSSVSVGANIILSFFFMWLLSFPNFFGNSFKILLDLEDIPDVRILGLIFAFSLSSVFYFFVLLFLFFIRTGFPIFRVMLGGGGRILLASVLAGIGVYGGLNVFSRFVDLSTFPGVFVQLFGAVSAGGIIYIFSLMILRAPELKTISQSLKSEFLRPPAT